MKLPKGITYEASRKRYRVRTYNNKILLTQADFKSLPEAITHLENLKMPTTTVSSAPSHAKKTFVTDIHDTVIIEFPSVSSAAREIGLSCGASLQYYIINQKPLQRGKYKGNYVTHNPTPNKPIESQPAATAANPSNHSKISWLETGVKHGYISLAFALSLAA
jgi:hypothetical protein